MFFDRQARDSVEAELGKDESLLWFGRPNALRVARKAYPFLLFGISAAAVSAWLTAQWVDGPMSHLLTATPADTVGMGLTLMVFWIIAISALAVPLNAYICARATIYALTNLRLLIVRKPRLVESFARGAIEQALCREFKDATGDLTITMARTQGEMESNGTIKLVGIPRVRTVERLLISIASPLGSPAQASSVVG